MMLRHPPMPPQLYRRVTWLSSSSLLLVVWLAVSSAQVRTTLTPDGTLGTTVTPNGNHYTIAGGTRPHNGPNLFHSFDRFNVGTNDTAHFTAKDPAGIKHILSRVTGGQPSEIYGTLKSTIPGAHLYLLNPSGVVFGPKATLDVQGAFHVSTADYLRLADGARFFARLTEQSTFSMAPPAAFGFLGPTPKAITVNGSELKVARGETFSLVGGAITLAGNVAETAVNMPTATPTLRASEGHIHLVSVASVGEVASPLTGQPLDLEVGSVDRLGRLNLLQGALVDVSPQPESEGRAGRVTVAARDVRLDNGHIRARTTSRGDGGEIEVQAGTLTLTQGAGIDVSTTSGGAGGEIVVRADTVEFTQGTRIDVSTKGTGRGGRVTVVASDVRLNAARISGTTDMSGAGGEVEVQAGTLMLTGGASIDVSSQRESAGQAGRVTVAVREKIVMVGGALTPEGHPNPSVIGSNALGSGAGGQVVVSAPTATVHLEDGRIQANVNESGSGRGGEVKVQAGTLTLTNGAIIGTTSFGAGSAGSVTVEATEAIRITDAGSVIASAARGSGDGGQVVVSAPTVRLQAGGSITAAAVRPASTDPPNAAKGGEITVQAGTLTLSGEGSSITSRTEGDGGGGNVTVWAREATITGGAQISSSSGRFSRSLGQFLAGRGDGGNVTIHATEALTIAGQNPTGTVQSGVVSQTFSAGNAGGVTIDTPRLTMAEGGRIGTDTGGDGRAGDVVVWVGSGALASGAQISSRSGAENMGIFGVGTGPGGIVTLTATEGVTLAGKGSGLSSSTAGQGRGGDIVVQAQQVQLTEGAAISAQSTSTGNAGTVLIQGPGGIGTFATRVTLTGSIVATDASVADGGDIQVRAQDTLLLRDSQITTAVRGGEGRGGNILIDPAFVILERSQIRADAFGGPGGNIKIVAQGFVTDADSQVSASSARNVEGLIDIQAAITPSGLVAPVPLVFASAAALLRSPCAARLHEGTVSTLVERGRAGVPATPDGVLPSRLPLIPLDTTTPTPDGGLPSAAHVGPPEGSQRDPSESLSLQGWTAPAGSLRLLGECASR
jgi:filamentous hemagglutinin family protein